MAVECMQDCEPGCKTDFWRLIIRLCIAIYIFYEHVLQLSQNIISKALSKENHLMFSPTVCPSVCPLTLFILFLDRSGSNLDQCLILGSDAASLKIFGSYPTDPFTTERFSLLCFKSLL